MPSESLAAVLADEKVKAVRKTIARVLGHEFLADNHDMLDNLCRAVVETVCAAHSASLANASQEPNHIDLSTHMSPDNVDGTSVGAEAVLSAGWQRDTDEALNPEDFDCRTYERWARAYGLDTPFVRLELAARLNEAYNANGKKMTGRQRTAIKLAGEIVSSASLATPTREKLLKVLRATNDEWFRSDGSHARETYLADAVLALLPKVAP